MMKKMIAWVLTVLMMVSAGAVALSEEEVEVPAGLVQQMGFSAAEAVTKGISPDDIVFYDSLTVGNTTAMHGDFFSELWGNATSDVDVRALLHGCNLIRWDGENGMFTVDPSVVAGITVTENAAGDRTFTFALKDNLRYSDGSPITAWDYAFSYLLLMSPEIAGAGGAPMRRDYIVGSEAFSNGTSNVLSGVRVTDDSTISVTLDADYLPFFYEMGLLTCNPYPISVIAPGVTVRDDGNGVYLDGPFTAQLLNGTLNGDSGYRTHPSVVSGPYMLRSFDGVTAEFDANPYFPGNVDGEMPLIPHLTYTLAKNETMMDLLADGTFDLINKVMNVDAINQGLQQIGEGKIAMSNYPRTGMSYVAFACERDTVSSPAVRQAIAYCMDRDALTEAYAGSYGLRVDGYYGIGQWMYGLVNGTIAPPVTPPENANDALAQQEYERELQAWDELALDLEDYALDTEKAAALLVQDGWALNADGLREKWINGRQVVLDLTMIYPEGNRIGAYFAEYLVPNLEQVGIRLTLKPVSMAELTEVALGGGERDADMFYQATNFDLLYDPAVYFLVENGQPGEWSFTRQTDAELYRRALVMRETEPGDVLEYMQKWVSFQERFNQTLPMIPIYSNVYFDFYTSLLRDYDIVQSSTWTEAILGSVKADIPGYEIEVAEDAEEAGDGEIVIDG